MHITQPNLYPELAEVGRKFDVYNSAGYYKNIQAYQAFLAIYKQGVLPQGEIFNLYNDAYLEQAIALFDLFYFAKDLDSFITVSAAVPPC